MGASSLDSLESLSMQSTGGQPFQRAAGTRCARAFSTPSTRRSASPRNRTHSATRCCHQTSIFPASPRNRAAPVPASGHAQRPSSGPDHYDASVDGPLATTGWNDHVVATFRDVRTIESDKEFPH